MIDTCRQVQGEEKSYSFISIGLFAYNSIHGREEPNTLLATLDRNLN